MKISVYLLWQIKVYSWLEHCITEYLLRGALGHAFGYCAPHPLTGWEHHTKGYYLYVRFSNIGEIPDVREQSSLGYPIKF